MRRGWWKSAAHLTLLRTPFPIKLALVVLRAECREQTIRLFTSVYHGPRLRPRLARRALSKDELLLLLLLFLSCRARWSGEEGADVAEGQADPGATFCWILCVLWPFDLVYAVHPTGVRREGHDEDRLMRKRNALRCALHRRATVTVGSTFPIGTLSPPAAIMSFFVLSVMVRRAPRERFTMRERRMTSIVLSVCSEM